MGRASRQKGRRWESKVAEWARTIWPHARITPIGVPGPDLVDTADVAIEAKNAQRLDVPAWARQAENQADGRPWMLVMHRPQHPDVDDAWVVLPGWYAAELLRARYDP